nr:hypothetical protein Iba_chr02dCG5340 [Ipomoea batatas]GMC68185.1 hypothetical protein Iba_scaffold61053CG0010 [Ipomoea batatas]
MPSDDSQNLSCRDYDDQGDEETLSASGGSSPARPVGPSVSKLNLTSGKFLYLDPCGAYGNPVDVSVKEEEQVEDILGGTVSQQKMELGSDLKEILGTTRKSSHGGKTSKCLRVVFKKKNIASSRSSKRVTDHQFPLVRLVRPPPPSRPDQAGSARWEKLKLRRQNLHLQLAPVRRSPLSTY